MPPTKIYPRLELLAWTPLRRLARSPVFLFVVRLFFVLALVLIISAGLFGSQDPTRNIAPLITWTVWWSGLVFILVSLGKAWCSVCPWNTVAGWVTNLRLWGRGKTTLSMGLRWPRVLRNIYPAVLLFLGLTWLELGFGITASPWITAALGLLMLVLAVLAALIFERRAFCRYACLVGRVSGLYAMFAPIELRHRSADVCRTCRTNDCFQGNAQGEGCPTFENPKIMTQNTYCLLCLECVKTCPHDNISMFLRPPASDLLQSTRQRADEAYLALVLMSMTFFHGLTMTPFWRVLVDAAERATGWGFLPVFTLLMCAVLLVPAAVYALFMAGAAALAGWRVRLGAVLVNFAYAVLPLALFYHLAHNSMHFFGEAQGLLAMVSDPFGWGWNLFGTAGVNYPALLSMPQIWNLQCACVVIGMLVGMIVAARMAARTFPTHWQGFVAMIPVTAFLMLLSLTSLWLMAQPMEVRTAI